jgi:hypothetical protein
LTTWRAAEHEKTAKHERIVQRYIDNLNAANRSQSASSGVHRATSSTEYATNPFMDAIYDAARAQHSLPRVSPAHPPSDSPPAPTPMDIDYGDNFPASVPALLRRENTRIRAAVDSAMKAYLDSSVIDASDSDDSGGDASERPAVYDQGSLFFFAREAPLMIFKVTLGLAHIDNDVVQGSGPGPGVRGLTAPLVYL